MATTPTIMQGDQLALVFTGKAGGQPLDTTEVERIEFSIGGTLRKCWPDEVTQDTEGNFLFPLTQQESFAVCAGPVHIQVRVKFYGAGDPVVAGVNAGNLRVEDSISKVVL